MQSLKPQTECNQRTWSAKTDVKKDWCLQIPNTKKETYLPALLLSNPTKVGLSCGRLLSLIQMLKEVQKKIIEIINS